MNISARSRSIRLMSASISSRGEGEISGEILYEYLALRFEDFAVGVQRVEHPHEIQAGPIDRKYRFV